MLRYRSIDSGEARDLGPGMTAIVAPEERHQVTPVGKARFYVAFYRRPNSGATQAASRR